MYDFWTMREQLARGSFEERLVGCGGAKDERGSFLALALLLIFSSGWHLSSTYHLTTTSKQNKIHQKTQAHFDFLMFGLNGSILADTILRFSSLLMKSINQTVL